VRSEPAGTAKYVAALAEIGQFPVVDNHCHGFCLDDIVARDPETWEDRLTMMGMCFQSSGQTDEALARQIGSMRESTVFLLAARRWLAEYLGVSEEDLTTGRHRRIGLDPLRYVHALLRDERITALITDDGYPQPPVDRKGFAEAVGVPVYWASRIEPWIVTLQREELRFDDFEAAFGERLTESAADPRTVAFKSIIAYRTGLDVGFPSRSEAREAYEAWRTSGWEESRGPAKTVRDYLLTLTLAAAQEHCRTVHIHCGGGDPDVQLQYARPASLYALLHRHKHLPVVLIHSGWPWLAEAAYMASILPNVYLDLSEFLPWASLAGDREVERLVGMVPASKLLYGSDEASEPEVLWLGARVMRGILRRVLAGAVVQDWLTLAQALRLARGILGENTRSLHGIA